METKGPATLEPLCQRLPRTALSAVASSVFCPLPTRYESVKGARKFTRSTLRSWGLHGQFDSILLVVSELVTNALRHALPGDGAVGQEPQVRLHLRRRASRLMCAVQDPLLEGPLVPELSPDDPDDTAESGRGLYLVAAFSDSWGWRPLPGDPGGKVVWALFRLPA